MTIKIKVGAEAQVSENSPKMDLKIRSTLDGNLFFKDHEHIDIIIYPAKKKIVTFAKNSYDDKIYSIQDRFFNFLNEKGVINRESVRGGNVYAAMEASYPDAIQGDALQHVALVVGKFLEEEKPFIEMENYYEEQWEKELLEPDDDESTEFGEVPHKEKQGSIPQNQMGRNFSAYGIY